MLTDKLPLDELEKKGLLAPTSPDFMKGMEERHRTVILPKLRAQRIAEDEAKAKLRTVRLF